MLLAAPHALAAAEPSETTTTGPLLVQQLLGATTEPYRLLARAETPGRHGYGTASVSAYVSTDGTHAVLHLAEARCMDIAEIV